MANIQLYIEGELVDYDNKSYTSLQKEFISEDELIVKEVEYSYTISIPVTTNNDRIFGFKSKFDVANKFSKVYNAQLYVGEQLIISGKFRMTEIGREYYKGNLYVPASQTISDILGDRMLNEIIPHYKPMNNLTDFTRQNNYVMGMNTTEIPASEYRDRHVCYPYVLYGLPYNTVDAAIQDGLDFYTQSLAYGKHSITNNNIFPAFNVCSVLKDMFRTEGYNLVGNIFDDEKFKDLYQTFQFNATDYADQRESPYYLKFNCSYTNVKVNGNSCTGSPTIQVSTLWDETVKNNDNVDGMYRAAVDNPLVSDDKHVIINVYKNDQHMLTTGETGARVIVVPVSGWYRLHVDGNMNYPVTMSITGEDAENIWYDQDLDLHFGGTTDIVDNTNLNSQPFEFQIKKGYAQENPQLYSWNHFKPIQPREYVEDISVKTWYNGGSDGGAMIKAGTNDSYKSRLFGKNGKQTLVRDYVGLDVSSFIGGARLGGARFTKYHVTVFNNYLQNRACYKGNGLTLPKFDRPLSFKTDEGVKYFMVESNENSYNQMGDTAQILLRDFTNPSAYTFANFDGFNVVDWNTGVWDTTSNPYKTTVAYSNNDVELYKKNVASTNGTDEGWFTINETVWLEKGDLINFELIMPYHYGGFPVIVSQNVQDKCQWVNYTNVSFNFIMAFVNSNKKWTPSISNPIPRFVFLERDRDTNVNKFLPSVKCNDYLNNVLKTFNLQLTHPSKNTFSIDYAKFNDLMGNVINFDDITNVKDAEFKVIESPSTRSLNWKIDKTETGYADGNKSPYKTENLPWYESGYTGSIEITNDANTSGTIDKTESTWSYNWYKNIKFLNGIGLSVTGAPVPVICESSVYSTDSSYGAQEGETLPTTKTSRLFFLSKNTNTNMYNYIEFKYDELDGVSKNCRLVIPTFESVTNNSSGRRSYVLDYGKQADSNRKSITDIFFNLSVQSGYSIDVPVKLTNEMYSSIKGGTLAKLNDGIYKIKSIEGHDVTGQENATISLVTLN